MIEEKNEEIYQQVFNWFKDVISKKIDDLDFDSKSKQLTQILERHNQKDFNLNIDNFEDIKLSTEEVFISNFDNTRKKREGKNLPKLLKNFLDNYSESIQLNEKAKQAIKNKNEEENNQLKNMDIQDKVYYNEAPFEIKDVNFQCSKNMGVKNLVVNKKYGFNVLKNLRIIPEEYNCRDVVADKNKLIQYNEKRYERFYERFQDYFDKNPKFERKFDKFPELNSEVIFIGRVILFQNDLKLKKNKVVLIEYQTLTGFNYVTSSFNELKDFFIFSNQMLILKGRKKKEIFIVESIINNLEFTNSQLELKEKNEDSVINLEENMKVMIIRGSFYQSNIDFEDLRIKIKKSIIKNKITLLIIIGPIIHNHRKNHPEKDSYTNIEENFQTMLSELGTNNLKKIFISDPTELTNYYNLPINKKRIVSINAPNPSIIKIGSFSFAFTASNLLDDLLMRSKSNFSNLSEEDGEIFEVENIERGLQALLESRNLAPVYGENSKIDPWRYNSMDYESRPDFFFVCSNSIDGFVSKIGNTHFVNFKSFIGKEEFGDFVVIGLREKDRSVSVEIFENN